MTEIALFTLLHILVFVYWLGGDLGAFYTSRFLTAPGVSADRRLLAAKIVGDVDMAPRTALILMFPTGLTLASVTGWTDTPLVSLIVVWMACLAWLLLAWAIHQKHGATPIAWRTADYVIRYFVLICVTLFGVMALLGRSSLPPFIGIKLLLFAGCILLGLLIRTVLKPLGPALAGLQGTDSAAAQTTLAQTLNRARPLVVCLWLLLISAAWIGIAKPQF